MTDLGMFFYFIKKSSFIPIKINWESCIFDLLNLMDNVTKQELILKGEIRDYLLILSLIHKYGLDQNLLI